MSATKRSRGKKTPGVLDVNRLLVRARYYRHGYRSARANLPEGSLFYRRGGEGHPLVLLHGFGFGALECWQNQARALAQCFDVIAPDLFYFGDSVADRTHDGSPRAQARAMLRMLEQLGIERAHVLGISYGGFIASEMAMADPERVARLVLVDAAGLEPRAEDEDIVRAAFPWAETLADVVIPPDVDRLQQFLGTVFVRAPFIPRFVLKEILEREFWRHSEKRREMIALAEQQLRRPADYARLAHKTLVAWGRHDPLLPPSFAERLVAALPDAELAMFERSGHVPMLEEPHAFNTLVTTFLAPRAVRRARRRLLRRG
ncbi:MAG: alpha/beta hydrolase [Myxococcales bacterium]|nr:alpha/beta hydrolase [Myxococcales bacterium]